MLTNLTETQKSPIQDLIYIGIEIDNQDLEPIVAFDIKFVFDKTESVQ